MKKMYVKPSMEVVEFCAELVMSATSMAVTFGGGDGKDESEVVEAESNNRRGGWGDLWN